jgi:predicted ATPase/class 3 adenylate cyclase
VKEPLAQRFVDVGLAQFGSEFPRGMRSTQTGDLDPSGSNVGAMPSGTVTFVFTDIEGSTIRWDRDRAAMERAVRLHDAIMRDTIAAHDGWVFKTIGDAFCAAFHRPEDAADATVHAQRALASADFSAVDGIRVRMAVHTGTADERDDDYFGPTVNRVARLLAVGYGGQVLLSRVTADLVQGALSTNAVVRDLGEHRLKDLSRPEHIFQLLASDLPAEFPPLRSLDLLANNLPATVSSFVGREREVEEITALLETHRLVTVVGSGGVGKTRISLQVAANLVDSSGRGVWFVEFAPLSSGDYLASTIALAMGLKLPGEGDATESLVRLLHDKCALLVFDNCEHLIEPAERVISGLLRGCRRIKMLATSRQSIGIAGEATYRLPSLTFPTEAQSYSLKVADALGYSAIALFAARARAADQRFAITDENAPLVADICRRLDGIALAVELAAPRVKLLSPRQLRDKLDERFRVLTGGNRDVPPRQQTLRALIDWSYDLLDARERALFRRLSIFVDGFTLEGATAVGIGEDLEEFDVFDLLASLVDKSLVLAEPGLTTVRYRMLESTRAYGREKLDAAGERDRCARSHLRFLFDVFSGIDERVASSGSRNELGVVFAVELDDVRAALDFALGADVVLGASLMAAQTSTPWMALGLESEILARTAAYLEVLPKGEARLSARLWHTIAMVSRGMGHPAHALETALEALTFARASGDEATLVFVASLCAGSAMAEGRLQEADAFLTEAEAVRNISMRARLILLQLRAGLRMHLGDYEGSVSAYEKLLSECRRIGDDALAMTTIENLSISHRLAGNTRRSNDLLREMLPQLRAQQNRISLGSALFNLAQSLVLAGEVMEAAGVAREGVTLHASIDPVARRIALNLQLLAWISQARGFSQRAAVLEGYASASLERLGLARDVDQAVIVERLRAQLTASLSPGELTRFLAKGAALSPEDAIALALEDA